VGTIKAHSERRSAPREKLDPIDIRGFTSLDHMTLLSRKGQIVEASKTGFLLHVERKAIVPKQFKDAFNLKELEGDRVILMIDPLNLEISGRIARTNKFSKDIWEIVIDMTDDSPEYWREILLEMLPRSSDFD
jgi:hypothetical protein